MSKEEVAHIVKDVTKALMLFAGLKLLMTVLSYIFMYVSLESLKIDFVDILNHGVDDNSIDPERVFDDVSLISLVASFIPMPLAFFYTFFSVPPKKTRHIFYCTVLISLIFLLMRYVFSSENYVIFAAIETINAVFFIWLPWVCSFWWLRIKNSFVVEVR